MERVESAEPAARATPSPWPLAWDHDLAHRFWSAVEGGVRQGQVFSRRCGRHLVASVAHHLPPQSQVWDLDARNGALAEALLAADYRVALDESRLIDPPGVMQALGTYQGFLGLLDRPREGSMDAVFWVDALEMVSREAALSRLGLARSVLKDHGVLIVTASNNERLEYGQALCPMCGALFHQWQHATRYTPETIEAVIREAGFEPVSVQQLELTEAAFRARVGVQQEFVANPHLHLGSGETLVVVAHRARRPDQASVPPWQGRPKNDPPVQTPVPRPVHWTRQRVADFWDGISGCDLVELGFGRQSGRHLLRVLAPWLVRGRRHLDYGAGTGDLAAILLEAGLPTATFEPSEEMRARQQARLGRVDGFLGVVDPEALETFDTVLLCEVIEHILPGDLDAIMVRLNRFLPVNGTLVVTTPNQEDLAAASIQCPHCDSLFHRWQHVRRFDAASLTDLLARFGFAPNVVHEVELTDAAFLASPYADLLFRATGPIRFGSGSTLIYIGRKVGEPMGTEVLKPLSAQSGDLPVSNHGQFATATLDWLESTLGAIGCPTGVLFAREPEALELWQLRSDSRVGPIVLPGAPGPDATTGLATTTRSLEDGTVPKGFALPPDLVFIGRPGMLSPRLGRGLARAGVRRVWFTDRSPQQPWLIHGWVRPAAPSAVSRWLMDSSKPFVDPKVAHLQRTARSQGVVRALVRQLLPRSWRDRLWLGREEVRKRLSARALRARVGPAVPLRSVGPLLPPPAFAQGPVILVNNALAWGGVERQVVYVLKGLVRDLHRPVALLCLRLHAGEDYRFYSPALREEPLEVTDIRDDAWSDSYLAHHVPAAGRDTVARSLCSLPEDVQVLVRRFLAEFLDRRPAVVHAWQDEVSIAAGYAAVIAGIPRVILSSRNMRPTNFDYYRPYMADGYRALAKVDTVILVNNSEAGAADYASWIGIAPERFVVKRNGIDPVVFQRASAPEVASFRSALGIPDGAPVVGSVFRLYDEKRPLLWVEMAAQVGRQYPNAHFVIFGTGPLQDQVRALAEKFDIGERFYLPGTTQRPHLAISAMDVFVLTSCFEGTPNVILEAQLLGVPVVATDAGGTREALDQGQTGWLVEDATPVALADRVLTVLGDPEWRARARDEAPRFVAERFGLLRMIQETRALYGLDERPQPEPGQASDRPQP